MTRWWWSGKKVKTIRSCCENLGNRFQFNQLVWYWILFTTSCDDIQTTFTNQHAVQARNVKSWLFMEYRCSWTEWVTLKHEFTSQRLYNKEMDPLTIWCIKIVIVKITCIYTCTCIRAVKRFLIIVQTQVTVFIRPRWHQRADL